MQLVNFQSMLKKIYFIFGRNLPANNERISYIYSQCSSFEDSSVNSIIKKFQELDSMPSNLVKKIQDFYHEWKRDQPAQSKAHCGCENGFIWCWVWVDKQAVRFLSKCPICASGEPVESLEARGVFVMPNDYKGGVLHFERDFYLGNVEPSIFTAAKKNDFLSKAKQISLVGINGQEIEEQKIKELSL